MKALVFFAHPDDETMLAGGTLALLARNNVEVHYLSATRGEGGETGEPPICMLEELGATREAELRCAVQELGGRSLHFLDYVDPRIGPDEELYSFTTNLSKLTQDVREYIQKMRTDVVLTHGSDGEYGHPAHITCHQAVAAAMKSLEKGDRPAVYTFAASFEGHPYPRLANPSDQADLVLDISPAIEQKIAAALCHRSQNALFVRRRSEQAGRPLSVAEVVLRLESWKRVYPEARWTARDGLRSFLESALLDR